MRGSDRKTSEPIVTEAQKKIESQQEETKTIEKGKTRLFMIDQATVFFSQLKHPPEVLDKQSRS